MSSSALRHRVVSTYDSHTRAEAGVKELLQSGLEMWHLSIVGKDFRAVEPALDVVLDVVSHDRASWGLRGAFWATHWGMFLGGAVFFIPIIGRLIVVGPLAAEIVDALADTSGGTEGALATVLTTAGIPRERVKTYESAVRAGCFLVFARGTRDVLEHAYAALGATGVTQLVAHDT